MASLQLNSCCPFWASIPPRLAPAVSTITFLPACLSTTCITSPCTHRLNLSLSTSSGPCHLAVRLSMTCIPSLHIQGQLLSPHELPRERSTNHTVSILCDVVSGTAFLVACISTACVMQIRHQLVLIWRRGAEIAMAEPGYRNAFCVNQRIHACLLLQNLSSLPNIERCSLMCKSCEGITSCSGRVLAASIITCLPTRFSNS